MIRNARVGDVEELNNLINHYAGKDMILPKSLSELYENIRDYNVCVENGNIIGCAALHVYWSDLAEIKSVVVNKDYQKKGIGKELVQECFEEGKALGISRLFVLTYVPEFFEQMGFKRVKKELFPQKIWTECVKCHKYQDCEGVPLMIEI